MAISARPSWFARGKKLATGLRHGFRSGLEATNAELLKKRGVKVLFEVVKIKYVVPTTERTYTVDFELPNGILVETKGLFEPTDRAKHLFVKVQHPELDIRIVLQRPNTPLRKGSPTTYAMWCDKYGIKWATKVIPEAWLNEPGPHGRPGKAGGERIIRVSQEVKDDIIGPPRQPRSALGEASRRASQMARKTARAIRDRLSPNPRPRRRKSLNPSD